MNITKPILNKQAFLAELIDLAGELFDKYTDTESVESASEPLISIDKIRLAKRTLDALAYSGVADTTRLIYCYNEGILHRIHDIGFDTAQEIEEILINDLGLRKVRQDAKSGKIRPSRMRKKFEGSLELL